MGKISLHFFAKKMDGTISDRYVITTSLEHAMEFFFSQPAWKPARGSTVYFLVPEAYDPANCFVQAPAIKHEKAQELVVTVVKPSEATNEEIKVALQGHLAKITDGIKLSGPLTDFTSEMSGRMENRKKVYWNPTEGAWLFYNLVKPGGRSFQVTNEDRYNFKLSAGYLEFRNVCKVCYCATHVCMGHDSNSDNKRKAAEKKDAGTASAKKARLARLAAQTQTSVTAASSSSSAADVI